MAIDISTRRKPHLVGNPYGARSNKVYTDGYSLWTETESHQFGLILKPVGVVPGATYTCENCDKAWYGTRMGVHMSEVGNFVSAYLKDETQKQKKKRLAKNV